MVIKMAKRQDYISWDEYFMGISLLSCLRSKDPNTQVGACIVNGDNHIVSVGYNGLPRAAAMTSTLGTARPIPPTKLSIPLCAMRS